MSRAPRCAPAPAPLVRTPASPRAIVHRRGRACASLHFHAPPTGRPEPRRAAHSPASRRASASQVCRRREAHPARRRSLRPLACAGQRSCPCAGLPGLGGRRRLGLGGAGASCERSPLVLQPASSATVAGPWRARPSVGTRVPLLEPEVCRGGTPTALLQHPVAYHPRPLSAP